MHLYSIYLKNFRKFKGKNPITLERDLTIFAANNGGGKTSILDAIALAFGAFLSRLPKVSGNTLSDRDICIQREKSEHYAFLAAGMAIDKKISTDVLPGDKPILWHRLKVFQGNKANRDFAKHVAEEIAPEGLKLINAYADYLVENVESDMEFPILAYYGTGRAILDIPQRRRGFGREFPRLQAYSDCLNPRTQFKKLFEYFYFLEDLERREIVAFGNLDYKNPQLSAIRAAVKSFLRDEYKNPRTALHPLRFLLDHKDGTTFSIEQLSDGYKTSLAMVMDIASRAVEANPKLGEDALKISGVVLIDEIELHLHPSWQQRIIPDLQRTFPNIQFICTTHSPQVLSTVKQKSIRLIFDDGTIKTGEELGVNTYGAKSYFIMEDLMNVSPDPHLPEVEALKNKLKVRQESSNLDINDAELQKLENMVGSQDPFIRNLKVSIIKGSKNNA